MALMNQKAGMKKNQAVDPQVEAESFLYKNEQGKIVVPSMAILGCMKAAGSDFKYEGKKTYKNLIYPGVRVYPEEWIPLTYEEWKPDLKIVVNPSTGGRQVRARPRFNTWSLNFQMEIVHPRIDPAQIQEILKAAGSFQGLLDFRPLYGLFEVTKFEQI